MADPINKVQPRKSAAAAAVAAIAGSAIKHDNKELKQEADAINGVVDDCASYYNYESDYSYTEEDSEAEEEAEEEEDDEMDQDKTCGSSHHHFHDQHRHDQLDNRCTNTTTTTTAATTTTTTTTASSSSMDEGSNEAVAVVSKKRKIPPPLSSYSSSSNNMSSADSSSYCGSGILANLFGRVRGGWKTTGLDDDEEDENATDKEDGSMKDDKKEAPTDNNNNNATTTTTLISPSNSYPSLNSSSSMSPSFSSFICPLCQLEDHAPIQQCPAFMAWLELVQRQQQQQSIAIISIPPIALVPAMRRRLDQVWQELSITERQHWYNENNNTTTSTTTNPPNNNNNNSNTIHQAMRQHRWNVQTWIQTVRVNHDDDDADDEMFWDMADTNLGAGAGAGEGPPPRPPMAARRNRSYTHRRERYRRFAAAAGGGGGGNRPEQEHLLHVLVQRRLRQRQQQQQLEQQQRPQAFLGRPRHGVPAAPPRPLTPPPPPSPPPLDAWLNNNNDNNNNNMQQLDLLSSNSSSSSDEEDDNHVNTTVNVNGYHSVRNNTRETNSTNATANTNTTTSSSSRPASIFQNSVMNRSSNTQQQQQQPQQNSSSVARLDDNHIDINNNNDDDDNNGMKDAPFTCLICMDDDVPPNERYSIGCQHTFCIDCWQGYLETEIQQATPTVTEFSPVCPHQHCQRNISESQIRFLIPHLMAKFHKLQVHSFVEGHIGHTMQWCPGPDCDHVAVKARRDLFLQNDIQDIDTIEARCRREQQQRQQQRQQQQQQQQQQQNNDGSFAGLFRATQENINNNNNNNTVVINNNNNNIARRNTQFVCCDACQTEFCFQCRGPHHRGLTCQEYEASQQQPPGGDAAATGIARAANATEDDNQDELRQGNGTARRKKCPSCAVDIEKNGGCNHMTCRCGHHFCWLCLEDMHGMHFCGQPRARRTNGRIIPVVRAALEQTDVTVDYICEALERQSLNDDEVDDYQELADSKRIALSRCHELQRFAHYYNRYMAHGQGQYFAENQCDCLDGRANQFRNVADMYSGTDADFFYLANQRLVASRRLLKYSYAYAYQNVPPEYRSDVDDHTNTELELSNHMALFLGHQERLERVTERLSYLSENALTRTDRRQVVDMIHTVDRCMQALREFSYEKEVVV